MTGWEVIQAAPVASLAVEEVLLAVGADCAKVYLAIAAGVRRSLEWHSRLLLRQACSDGLRSTSAIIERLETYLIKDGPELAWCGHVEYPLRRRFYHVPTFVNIHRRASLDLALAREVESWPVFQVFTFRLHLLHDHCIRLILLLKSFECATESDSDCVGVILLWWLRGIVCQT